MEDVRAMEEPNLRLYRKGDEIKIFELLRIVFPAWKAKSLDH